MPAGAPRVSIAWDGAALQVNREKHVISRVVLVAVVTVKTGLVGLIQVHGITMVNLESLSTTVTLLTLRRRWVDKPSFNLVLHSNVPLHDSACSGSVLTEFTL